MKKVIGSKAIQIIESKFKPFNKPKTIQMNNNCNATKFKPSKVNEKIVLKSIENVFV